MNSGNRVTTRTQNRFAGASLELIDPEAWYIPNGDDLVRDVHTKDELLNCRDHSNVCLVDIVVVGIYVHGVHDSKVPASVCSHCAAFDIESVKLICRKVGKFFFECPQCVSVKMLSLVSIDAIQQNQPARGMVPNRCDYCWSFYAIWRNQTERLEGLDKRHPGEVSHDFNFAPYTKRRSDCSNKYG
jgi:hypothetical protein